MRVDLLIVDDLALQALDQTETQDFYEIVVDRHQVSSTIVTSNREPGEWLDVMADPMLAQRRSIAFRTRPMSLSSKVSLIPRDRSRAGPRRR